MEKMSKEVSMKTGASLKRGGEDSGIGKVDRKVAVRIYNFDAQAIKIGRNEEK